MAEGLSRWISAETGSADRLGLLMADQRMKPSPSMPACAPSSPQQAPPTASGFWGLALGSIGVVFGDIGTSPLYAFKESVSHVAAGAAVSRADVMGVVSLMFWALMIIVTLKYVLLLMRFDNKGEGGVLSLVVLARRVLGSHGALLLGVGVLGAALFYGDAMLTPAISVLSAVEGLTIIPSLAGRIDPFIVPIALGVLLGLFLIQRRGTGLVGAWFGPICLVWFFVIAALGVQQLIGDPGIVAAISPAFAWQLMAAHPLLSFVLLGSVFLTVTGAEALYADMGHFGRAPISASWLLLVFPSLTLNYLGQGALVLAHPEAISNPFFLMAPEMLRPALVVLATAATIIASQAVISGAYSLTQQAIQLGLLPRLEIVQTSAHTLGQIFMPQVNFLLLVGVVLLVVIFKSSSALASAYGISVIGAMITSSLLAIVAIWKLWKRPLWQAIAIMAPFILVEGVFLASNLLKIFSGGFVPLLIASALILIMWTWIRGTRLVREATRRDGSLKTVLNMLAQNPPHRVRGTAVFLTADPDTAPEALMHNLKHNHILHERMIILTVRTAAQPRVDDKDIVLVEDIAPDVKRVTLTYGFMQSPNVVHGLALARARGLQLDIMKTSFFVSRRALVANAQGGLPRLQGLLYIWLTRNATVASEFFHIPASRVVELGAQLAI
jgi:KUP system potassium uptake protein